MLPSGVAARYNFVVCGSGSSGSAVAGRLAENPDVTVLLLEAGGSDDVTAVRDPAQWAVNLASERDWGYLSQPSVDLNGRSTLLSMGKVLGGGSSINVMVWAQGHSSDWDYFAAESGDDAWAYRSVLDVYRRIEDWHGPDDPEYRGSGGPMFIAPASDPNPLAPAVVDAARSVGIPSCRSSNGSIMEGDGGAAIADLTLRDGSRQSVFRSYVQPLLHCPNLTVLTAATVTRLVFDRNRVVAVQFLYDGKPHLVAANYEVIVSLGAVHTPQILMRSGIGDADDLRPFGIPVVTHLPGVGHNYQNHPRIDCMWEWRRVIEPRNNGAEATIFWMSDPKLAAPDLQISLVEVPLCSRESAIRYRVPEHAWTMCAGVLEPKSRGQVRLSGPNPSDRAVIEANMLADPDDMNTALAGIDLCREIGNAASLQPFSNGEVMPGALTRSEMVDFVRNAAESHFHPCGTTKMGRDSMSVVDGSLKVYGVEGLRIADASIMPRITTGNTMAPCVVIGERAADFLKAEHGL